MTIYSVLHILYDFFRGTTFRDALLKVGEVHSLVPEKTAVMALTACYSYPFTSVGTHRQDWNETTSGNCIASL